MKWQENKSRTATLHGDGSNIILTYQADRFGLALLLLYPGRSRMSMRGGFFVLFFSLPP